MGANTMQGHRRGACILGADEPTSCLKIRCSSDCIFSSSASEFDRLDCGKVALHLKAVLNALKLESFVKGSGSKGLHLSVPLNSRVTYEMTQPFAKAMAELVEGQLPNKVVSAMAKTLLRGKVLIDWSQNSDFKTTVCAYAMRTKDGGPLTSMPITWQELAKAVKNGKPERLFFSPDAAVKRIKRLGDLFASG